ncbi:MAG TPA: trypsin-like peptidase domain-containing protein [Pseudonocardiaceae bacterium]|nr:trypsin-like peptidase domain-containing protein [Pseudonocardiaceae bacterium]
MTENYPGAAGGPADGPDRPTDATPPPAAETVSNPVLEPDANPNPAPPARTASYGVPPAGETVSQPVSSAGETVAHPGPSQSAPMPVAHVPASSWSPLGQQSGGGSSTGPQPMTPVHQSGYQPTNPTYPGYQPPGGPPTGPITYPLGGLPPDPPRRRIGAGVIAGIAALALVVGGLAGGLGGYLVAGRSDDAGLSALEQQAPASQTSNAPPGSAQAVANKVLPVVVTIAAEFQAQGDVNGDTGSGVIISSNGDILTNNHVIAEAANGGHIQVIFASGRTVDATVVGRDPTTDIAVIKAQGVSGLPIAQLGRSDDLAVGQNVVAIGAPFALSGTVTSGIISSLHRPTEAGDGSDASQTTVLDAIQTDAPINPGNSGGPLVNMQGQVIGINSAIYSPQSSNSQSQGGNVGIGFAIPINQAKRTADEIVRTGFATQTLLGVKVEDNTPTQGGQPSILPNGALITQVTAGGPADKAGLKAGSVVVKADGRQVTSSDGLVAAVHAAAPGDKMTLTMSNGSTVTVTLGGQTVHPS